jgi:hypothetical protein
MVMMDNSFRLIPSAFKKSIILIFFAVFVFIVLDFMGVIFLFSSKIAIEKKNQYWVKVF